MVDPRKRQQEIWRATAEFLLKFNQATDKQIFRVVNQGKTPRRQNRSRLLNNMKRHDLIKSYKGFQEAQTWTIKNTDLAHAYCPELQNVPVTDPNSVAATTQTHSSAITSLASQILAAPKQDVLGLGQKYWEYVRAAVLSGNANILSEKQINSSWKNAISTKGIDALHDEWDSYAADPALLKNEACQAALNEDYFNEYLFRLATGVTIFNSNADASSNDRYLNGRGLITTSSAGNTKLNTEEPGQYALTDHPADGVLTFSTLDGNGIFRITNIAFEMELHVKPVEQYIKTLAAFQTPQGRALYSFVIWYYPNDSIANALNKAIAKVGNIGNQIQLVKIESVENGRRLYYTDDIQLADTKPLTAINQAIYEKEREGSKQYEAKQAQKATQTAAAYHMKATSAAQLDDDAEGFADFLDVDDTKTVGLEEPAKSTPSAQPTSNTAKPFEHKPLKRPAPKTANTEPASTPTPAVKMPTLNLGLVKDDPVQASTSAQAPNNNPFAKTTNEWSNIFGGLK